MKKISALIATAALCLIANNAFAGDTSELLDNGQIEVSPSFGVGNITDGVKPNVFAGLTVGYGVTEYMTLSANLGWNSFEALAGNNANVGFDALFTPLDTEHFDIDVHFSVSTSIIAGGLVVNPGFEFNYDTSNDMDGFGAYIRLELPIHSEYDMNQDVNTDFDLEVLAGLYFYVVPDHQLVVEGGITTSNLASKIADAALDGGFVSIGWNYAITDSFELLTECAIDIPKGGDGTSAAFTIGGNFDFQPIPLAGEN